MFFGYGFVFQLISREKKKQTGCFLFFFSPTGVKNVAAASVMSINQMNAEYQH